MKTNLQFTISCQRCPANEVFNALLMFVDVKRFAEKAQDATAYFEATGWLHLPSGNWICRKDHKLEIRSSRSGDIELDERFWDCDCVSDFIHPKTVSYCVKCRAYRDEQPNSRASEVAEYFPNAKAKEAA